MEQRYITLSKQLVDLGYKYTLGADSVLLVEKLVADLIETTENLRKYMKIAQDAIEERDNLRFGAEPYKCDNARLVKECNDLHLTLVHVKEENEKQQRELRKRIANFEKEREDFIKTQKELRQKVREFELETVRKNDRNFQNQLRRSGTSKFQSVSAPVFLKSGRKDSNPKSFELSSAMALADQKIANQLKEVNKLKAQQMELLELNAEYKTKLNSREKEIQRLMELLEGGRPLAAINNECCYKDVNLKILSLQDEVVYLEKMKLELEAKLREARCKQHEAMKNALHLAERNKELEKELREIDEMALTVEQECNATVKNKTVKVKRLQEKLNETTVEVQNLEKELLCTKRNIESLKADNDAINIEKRHLQNVLETALDDKKELTNKINRFTIIEKDLNNEIDRLVRENADCKRKNAELKVQGNRGSNHISEDRTAKRSQLSKSRSPSTSPKRGKHPTEIKRGAQTPRSTFDRQHLQTPKTAQTSSEPIRIGSAKALEHQRHKPTDSPTGLIESEFCIEKLKALVENEVERRYPSKTNSLERIRTERDFYIKEYQKLIEQLRGTFRPMGEASDNSSLVRKLQEKDDLIAILEHEKDVLSKEKHGLLSRLENVRDYTDDADYITVKTSMKRLERERDILKSDVERLEEERDTIKHRVKVSSDLQNTEVERYQKMLSERDEQIKKYEKERHDLLHNQGSRRVTMANLEDECGALKDELQKTQVELTQQKTIYAQLKILHEQTDRALADSNLKLSQAQKELMDKDEKQSYYASNASTLNNDVTQLKSKISGLQMTLSTIEHEKDTITMTLDDKTERIAFLESEVKLRDGKIRNLEERYSQLQAQMSLVLDDRNVRESRLKSSSSEVLNLSNEIQNANRAKEAALQENRRLQDELAACTVSSRTHQSDLEIARRQIDDLKRQLQHYVAEVKRIEDLMTQKEVERSEMLDQFRSLSHEATILENNNHSLEHEASQSKVQLSVALDHATTLERRLDEQEGLIRTYERQITEMTSQIATLEIQIKHYQVQYERGQSELNNAQDLLSNLEMQKQEIHRNLKEQEDLRLLTEQDLSRAKVSSESLRRNMEKDQTTVEHLESLLGENRRETIEQRLLNQDLQEEVIRLKKKIQEMEQNLATANERLDVYQEKALEYSQQNKQLRREIANERFFHSKDEEKSSNKYPSL